MTIFTVVCFLVWIYLLSVFTRGKLYFYLGQCRTLCVYDDVDPARGDPAID